MVKSAFAICLLFVAVSSMGCGGPESTAPPSNQEMGTDAKQQVLDFVAATRENTKGAPEKLALMMESLDAYATDYGDGFVVVRDEAAKLKGLFESSAGKPEIDAQLQKLAEAAEALSSAGQ